MQEINSEGKENALDIMLQEGQVQMRLSHPNIVQLLDMVIKQSEMKGYLVMELCRGTLHEFWKGNLFGREKYLEILRAVTTGLEFIHSNGYIHRGVKETNILRKPYSVLATYETISVKCN